MTTDFNFWDFAIRLVTAVSLWAVINAYFKLKHQFEDRMNVFNVISFVRNKRLFIKYYEKTTFGKLPNETDEDYYNRIPQGGLFDRSYEEEYNIVRDELINNKMKDKKVQEIDDILSKFYPIDNV